MVPSTAASAPYPGRMSRWSASVGEALLVDPAERRGPHRFDLLVVLLLAIGAAVELAVVDWSGPVIHVVTSAAAIAVLPWRRVLPLATVAVAFSTQLTATAIQELVRDADLDEVTFAQGIAGVMLIYALCRWESPGRLAAGLAIGIGFATVGESAITGDLGTAWQDLIAWAIVAGFALAMRYRAALRRAREREARLAERNDLARELHDSVAHHLSAIAVQAQAARYVSADDPNAAVDALALIETTAGKAIDEMRHIVGILRSDQAVSRSVSSTSLLDFVDTGSTPKVSVAGAADLSDLSSLVAAAAYRITQEAITNARRHADGVTFVDIECSVAGDELILEIVNDGTPTTRRSGGGFGLIGMEERAEALGGSLEAGPHPSAGWIVSARLPLVQS